MKIVRKRTNIDIVLEKVIKASNYWIMRTMIVNKIK